VLTRRFPVVEGSARFLEVGFGNATVLEYLKQRGVRAEGLDATAAAVVSAAHRGLGPVYAADGRRTPFADAQFDGIGLFDVLEHIADHDSLLLEAHRLLLPGGKLILTVPSDPKLWSRFDEAYGHHRRYRGSDLANALERNGFAIEWMSHFMFFLYPTLRLVRWVESRRNATGDFRRAVRIELRPPAALNYLFLVVLRVERWLLRRIRLPIGGSLIAVAVKPAA
jgi:SAM-dependent methyltransferase